MSRPSSPIGRACLGALALLVLGASGAHAQPGATIGPVSCDAGGSVVTMTNASGAPARFVLLRDEHVIATVTVPAGPAVRHVVPVAEGAAAQVTARYGSSYTSGFVRRGCTADTVRVAAPVVNSVDGDATAAPFEAAMIVPATGTRAIVRPADAPTSQDPRERDVTIDSVTTWPVLAFAALAVLAAAGAALVLVRSRGASSAGERARRAARRSS